MQFVVAAALFSFFFFPPRSFAIPSHEPAPTTLLPTILPPTTSTVHFASWHYRCRPVTGDMRSLVGFCCLPEKHPHCCRVSSVVFSGELSQYYHFNRSQLLCWFSRQVTIFRSHSTHPSMSQPYVFCFVLFLTGAISKGLIL